ncbi:polyunsaturated fatty acid lipoxygenase ALOX15B-like [Eleutherodactylus coqui]|uniref:polyunsaturated fatty acid lipoxygenase ALOX15B-like n=1 Tax=Eleutherodactylus coqui TaxID=57060 RepID=UPI003462CAA6
MALYKVTVATGSEPFAGTVNSISISLVGVKGESAKQELSHLLLPGTVCDYELNIEEDIGMLLSVRLFKETYLFPVQDAWYCQYVKVINPIGKLHLFPVYQWVSGDSSVLFPEGRGSILSTSSGNLYMEQRKMELEKNREVYKWKMLASGCPYCIDADSSDDLPINERYSYEKRGSFLVTELLSNLEVGLKGFMSSTDSWRNVNDIKTVFYFNRTDISDKVSKRWNEDSFFGYQYLNGINPMVIRKCLNIPENFPVTSSMVAASVGTSTDLQKELQNGNVFLADYKILQGIPIKDSINGKRQYMTVPMCLLWKDPQDKLLPIAIQLGQTPGEQTPIFLPSDSEWDWTLAKIWVRNAEYQVHQTISHLLQSHLFAEVFTMATHRQLPRNHPVYKLLIPHLRYTLDINTLAKKEVAGSGGTFDQILVLSKKGVRALVRRAMEEMTYSALCLPEHIKARGLESIPNYFYRDDGQMIWEAMERFVSNMVQHYYKSDESVWTDPELQAWVAEICEKGFLSNESSGIPSSLETVSSLVRYLTMVIFRCSAQHAAVNSGQFDFYAWMPNGPPSIKSPPPTAKGVTTIQSILDALPDVKTTTTSVVSVWQLSKEPQDQRRLGCYPDEHFTEETPQIFIKEFQEKLSEISKIINERNQTRSLPYHYLDPKVIENSVSI